MKPGKAVSDLLSKLFLDSAKPFDLRPSLKCITRDLSRQTVVYKDDFVSVSSIPLRFRLVTYIARFRDMPGKLDVSLAAELGVLRGRLYGVLKMGKSVALDDGTEGTTEQVMKPATPGPVLSVAPNLTIEELYDALTITEDLSKDVVKTLVCMLLCTSRHIRL